MILKQKSLVIVVIGLAFFALFLIFYIFINEHNGVDELNNTMRGYLMEVNLYDDDEVNQGSVLVAEKTNDLFPTNISAGYYTIPHDVEMTSSKNEAIILRELNVGDIITITHDGNVDTSIPFGTTATKIVFEEMMPPDGAKMTESQAIREAIQTIKDDEPLYVIDVLFKADLNRWSITLGVIGLDEESFNFDIIDQ